MLRIGHGGAAALARANTVESFDAALEAGVDMIEFDVRGHGGRLLLAHTPIDARFRDCLTLRDALRHLAGRRFAGLRFDLDLKSAGIEEATLDAMRAAGMTDRCLISCRSSAVLDRFKALDPCVRTAVSIRRAGQRPDVLAGLEGRRFDAVMAQHKLADAAFVARVHERHGEVYAWTVDERALVERLRRAGVSGVVTNDPRLFAPAVAG